MGANAAKHTRHVFPPSSLYVQSACELSRCALYGTDDSALFLVAEGGCLNRVPAPRLGQLESSQVSPSNRHLHLDRLVRHVARHLQVLVLEGVDVGFLRRVYGQGGERARLPAQLLPQRVDVVDVDVRVADGVDELPRLQATRLRQGEVGGGRAVIRDNVHKKRELVATVIGAVASP